MIRPYFNFRVKFIFRLLFLILLGCSTVYLLFQSPYWLVSIWTSLGFVLLLIETVRFAEKSFNELSHFLLSIEQNDFTNSYSARSQKNDLQLAFHRLSNVFQRLRTEKEFHFQYFQTVVEHIAIPLLCYNENEEIVLLNRAAQKLFEKPYIRHLSTLDKLYPDLGEIIRNMASDDREVLKMSWKKEMQTFAIDATVFKLLGQAFKLISIHNIQNELEAQELESWQKLIRVLTHEIMNSVIPISSLSSVSAQILKETDGQFNSLTVEDFEDLQGSLTTIENRSKGLINFVKAYKSLSRISEPHFEPVSIKELISEVSILLKPQLEKQHIQFATRLEQDSLKVMGDVQLLEQVLINLIVNAIDAVKYIPSPQIQLSAFTHPEEKIFIQLQDNGPGISSEMLEQIFIPFFTTKKKGSGIGLSLSKQIMNLHKGKISVSSTPEEGTTFTISMKELVSEEPTV